MAEIVTERRTVTIGKRQIQDLLKEMNVPLLFYTILYGLYLTHRLNYSWKFLNDADNLTRSDGVNIIIFLVCAAFAFLFLIPIITKFIKIARNLRSFRELSENANKSLNRTIFLIYITLLNHVAVYILTIIPTFNTVFTKYVGIIGVFGIELSVMYLLAFRSFNKTLKTLKEEKLYNDEPIMQLEISQYIFMGAWALYIIIGEVFVVLGINGYRVLGDIFFLTFFIAAIMLMLGLDRWKNRIEYIVDK
ncbi:MAG: hypothetical protein ACTSYD_05370 [Candidatus Heimdallarchaeaceae archaeon]